MPLVGPANIEEMNARIDRAEQEMEHDNGFSWEQVMLDAQALVNRYATTQKGRFFLCYNSGGKQRSFHGDSGSLMMKVCKLFGSFDNSSYLCGEK